jgi:DNA-binding NtrC family response regulator
MPNDASVLVLDENPSRRTWIHQVLGTLPCRIVEVRLTHQALRSLKMAPASAVVIGAELRRTDLRRFQAVMRKHHSDIPVVVASRPRPVGTDLTRNSPGGYHCLVSVSYTQLKQPTKSRG